MKQHLVDHAWKAFMRWAVQAIAHRARPVPEGRAEYWYSPCAFSHHELLIYLYRSPSKVGYIYALLLGETAVCEVCVPACWPPFSYWAPKRASVAGLAAGSTGSSVSSFLFSVRPFKVARPLSLSADSGLPPDGQTRRDGARCSIRTSRLFPDKIAFSGSLDRRDN